MKHYHSYSRERLRHAAQLTDSEIETTTLAVEHEAVPIVVTRYRRPYLKDFGMQTLVPLSY